MCERLTLCKGEGDEKCCTRVKLKESFAVVADVLSRSASCQIICMCKKDVTKVMVRKGQSIYRH